MIQSEVQLIYKDSKKKAFAENTLTSSTLCPKKKQRVVVLNHELLCSEYQAAFLAGMSLVQEL